MAIAMASIATAFLIGAYWLKEEVLAWAAVPFWMIAGAAFYQASTSLWDVQFAAAFICIIGMIPASAVSVFFERKKRKGIIEREGELEEDSFEESEVFSEEEESGGLKRNRTRVYGKTNDSEDESGKKRRRTIRANKKIKKAMSGSR